MSINSNIPQIAVLRQSVEKRFGKRLIVHTDFITLVSAIEKELRAYLREHYRARMGILHTRLCNCITPNSRCLNAVCRGVRLARLLPKTTLL